MVSFTYAAFLVVIDSLCITCYLLIKSVRKLTDERMREYPSIGEAVTSGSTAISSAITALSGSNSSEEDAEKGFAAKAKMVGKAAVLENTSMTPNTVERFPDWQPLPYRCGIITMLVLLGLTTLLLTPSILLDKLGVAASSSSSSLQLCRGVEGGIDGHIKKVQETLANITRIEYARFEDSYTKEFAAALSEDTSRYGTDEYPCGEVDSQKRKEWENINANKTFFTGWCEEKRSEEIEASEKRTITIPRECKTVEVKACADSWGLKWFCASASEEVCTPEIQYPSPDVNAVDNHVKLAKYQMEVERMERLREANLNTPKTDVTSIVDDISEASSKFGEQLKYQVDFASYLYILYLWVAAFFPSPIVLFRSSPSVRLKRNIFGMRKETFVLTVLVIWFGISYFKKFALDPSIQLYLANLSANPCYADPAFLKQKQQAISDVCSELGKMNAERTIRQQDIEQKLFMADFMLDTCGCRIPDRNLTNYMFKPAGGLFVSKSEGDLPEWAKDIGMKARNAPYYEYIGLGWWSKLTYGFYLPERDSPSVGNTTVCENPEYQREQIHEAPESGMNWFQLWISSGMLAELATKLVAANFCVAILKSADPLGSINGM
ncbi:hypothetical protein QTG54_006525 [Skeletonema marinoi]|uniref:Uncharacterized protein n=1 Tax=Skeletonema marinoi TaxID=267567 RepID=A0AAD8YB21_9STRA|nr:hypothetical protein QTG54_006525 [Skeletonema marinoi]